MVRETYKPSGKVAPQAFLAAAAGLLLIAAAIGWLLGLAFEQRFYTPLAFSFAAALAMAALGLLAVRLGRCRSPLAAMMLGLLAGLSIQPGQHVAIYLQEVGWQCLSDPQAFLKHLDRRLAAAEMDWSTSPGLKPDDEAQPGRGDYFFLWGATLVEAVAVSVFILLPMVIRVRREPFCEGCDQWMVRYRLSFQAAAGQKLLEALETGTLLRTAQSMSTEAHPNRTALIGILDLCKTGQPGVAWSHQPPGFLTLKQRTGNYAGDIQLEAFMPYDELLVRCAALEVAEVEGLLDTLGLDRPTAMQGPRIIPGEVTILEGTDADGLVSDFSSNDLSSDDLPRHGAASNVEFLDSKGNRVAAFEQSSHQAQRDPRALAEIQQVSQAHPPPAADGRHLTRAKIFGATPIVSCVVAFPLALLLAYHLVETQTALALTIVSCGLLWSLLTLWLTIQDPNFFGDRYLLRRLRHRLAQRGYSQVHPDDPDAIAVALVPRSVWAIAGAGGQEKIDRGLLAIRHGTVFYEGDRQRFRIPADSIRNLDWEKLRIDQYQTWTFSVLDVESADGGHTLPFVPIGRPPRETLFTGKHGRGMGLYEKLRELVPEL